MAIVSPARKLIFEEETRYQAAVSESTFQKLAATHNFISTQQYTTKRWNLNGNYSLLTLPANGIDGPEAFLYNAEIIGIYVACFTVGSGGSTTFDIQYKAPAGSWTSIFSTLPSIPSSSGSDSYLLTIKDPVTSTWSDSGSSGITSPVVSFDLPVAASQIRCTLTAAQTGSPNGAHVSVFWRPR